jgi:transmembrane sensor
VNVGVYRTAKGEQTHIQLSDGTRIDLNTDTELQVGVAWLSRKVTLMQGEAFFTVTHNPDQPFEVTAADGLIRDIGTQFNVYRHGDQVSVSVLEGEVSVTSAQTTQPQNLSAGMQLTYHQGGQAQLAQSTDPADASAWRENRMVFKGQTLATVLEQLERYHNVRLATQDPKLQALKVSGSFPTDNLDLALDTIAASLPVKITRNGANGVVLARDKPKP